MQGHRPKVPLEWLRPGGRLVLEIGARQGEAAAELLASAGLTDVEVSADLAGRRSHRSSPARGDRGIPVTLPGGQLRSRLRRTIMTSNRGVHLSTLRARVAAASFALVGLLAGCSSSSSSGSSSESTTTVAATTTVGDTTTVAETTTTRPATHRDHRAAHHGAARAGVREHHRPR